MAVNYARILASRRVQLLIAVTAIALLLIAFRGLNYGIEFEGGVRIPITLISEKGVSAEVMTTTVETLKQRINKYGLSQSVVRPLGDREIIVEIPKADEQVIKSIEKILREQGRFEALIDGKVALEGRTVLQNAIGGANGERVSAVSGGGYQWELDFAVSREGGELFSKVAYGKANFPVYMMLDRPENAAVIVSKNSFNAASNFGSIESAMLDALRLDGNNIELVYSEDIASAQVKIANKSKVFMSESVYNNTDVKLALAAAGFSNLPESNKLIVVRPDAEMVPETYSTRLGILTVNRWRGIGLLSAPTLSEGLAGGTASTSYSITGSSSGNSPDEQKRNALSEIKELKSVISGGKLPVSTVIGSAYVVAPELGEQFLQYSFIGMIVAIFVVSIWIVIRYRRLGLVVPIIVISAIEIFLTTTVIGVFGTLDLAAVAGIIALIGMGVNDQIIITDEILKHGKVKEEEGEMQLRNVKDRIAKAFYIILAVAGAIIAAMLPLLLSGIVEVMGFALSTIVGVLIGIGITRPAFSVIVQELS